MSLIEIIWRSQTMGTRIIELIEVAIEVGNHIVMTRETSWG